MQLLQERPPFVTFEFQAEEDRNASIEAGYMIFKNTPVAIIQQAGSRDTVVKNADEWMQQMKRNAMEGRAKMEWFHHYEAVYKAWKEGNEMPEFGTPIKGCLVFTPAEQMALLQISVRTIEDAASMNEQAMSACGMGGRELKARAIDALTRNTAAVEENKELKARAEEQEHKIAVLMGEIEKLQIAMVKLSEKRK